MDGYLRRRLLSRGDRSMGEQVTDTENKELTVVTCEYCSRVGAETDAQLRNRSLTLSSVVIIILSVAHVVFEWNGKTLTIPDFYYVVASLPWVGASLGKLIRTAKVDGLLGLFKLLRRK